jgi:hypothetical protein
MQNNICIEIWKNVAGFPRYEVSNLYLIQQIHPNKAILNSAFLPIQ